MSGLATTRPELQRPGRVGAGNAHWPVVTPLEVEVDIPTDEIHFYTDLNPGCDGRRVIMKWRDYAVNRTGDIPPFQLLDLFF
jgi:hypothetical protein